MGDHILDKKKIHKDPRSGRKAEKKKQKKNSQNSLLEELADKRNPKAFAFNSAVQAERRFRRKQDIETKKQHIPLIDRTPIDPPPVLIAVVGPPKVGKSILIKSLIKLFTRSPLADIKGPVTIVTGKKRRVTFIECNNDINSMIDLAKVADIALLLCDASFGFEMEVFEFLNICQVHGMPRIMGVLTHLDMIKNSKTLKTIKKTLKHRFWTEVYPGAKLFYLSGIIHEEYLKNEIKNLGRFISIMKFRPLQWRTTHSYLIGDRYEDLTNLELIRKNPNCDRNISLYGYVRGVPLKKESSVHVAGLGDLKIHDISYLPDPCPLPQQIKKRALVEKEKLIYAPFSGVGGIVYDKDAVYVELGGSHSHNKCEEENNILACLINTKETLDIKIKKSELQIFTGSKKISENDLGGNQEEIVEVPLYEKKVICKSNTDLENELNELRKKNCTKKIEYSRRLRRKVVFDDTDDELTHSIFDASDNVDAEGEVQSHSDIGYSFEYKDLKVNKDKHVLLKVNNVLQKLNLKEVYLKSENVAMDENNTDLSLITHNKNITYKTANGEIEHDNITINITDKDFNGFKDISSSNNISQDENSDFTLDEYEINSKWKENLTKRTEISFLNHQNSSKNLMKLVYGVFDSKQNGEKENTDSTEEENIAGLFKKVLHNQQEIKLNKDIMDLTESCISPWNTATRNWSKEENKALIANCFVTGKWKEFEDANDLLRLASVEDFSDVNSEIFGDFEDLETGERSTQKRKRNESEKEAKLQMLSEKKRKLKEKFNSEYDNTEKTDYYDNLKICADKQAELNKTFFENIPDDKRVELEGFRSGMYVRIEFEGVPAEFINNFDPTYPLIIGSLNICEENIGYINVKIKKHRWYNNILKTNDPLIISLGWRRFQTMPLYSKLEDDLKYRYLKYTPEHLACNAHFWGPITPQGTGFLALQVVDSSLDVNRKLGFRIAATGSIQELDKSTEVMKKLKLVGYPLKIYKKTAFIKGMFSSALEVAKFEGARIKTVSGIRGQIKKAVNKPEGCFRATFEDKIQLSDIVFCRTWYRVNVTEFYNPVNTLLLPPDKKDAWRGVRTTGEIKKEMEIRNSIKKDSVYMPISRHSKPFKPLVVPQKLQKILPYSDKAKYSVKSSDPKTFNRVAVIREPQEQKISTMMKMIKASYEQKQEKLKREMKERLAKHRQGMTSQITNKQRKLKQKKKVIFKNRSKTEIQLKNRCHK